MLSNQMVKHVLTIVYIGSNRSLGIAQSQSIASWICILEIFKKKDIRQYWDTIVLMSRTNAKLLL